MATIFPDTCVPTCTVFTALSAPVDWTVCCTSPRSTAPNRYEVPPADFECRKYQASAPSTASTATAMRTRERVTHGEIGVPEGRGGGETGCGWSARGRLAGATLVTMVPELR